MSILTGLNSSFLTAGRNHLQSTELWRTLKIYRDVHLTAWSLISLMILMICLLIWTSKSYAIQANYPNASLAVKKQWQWQERKWKDDRNIDKRPFLCVKHVGHLFRNRGSILPGAHIELFYQTNEQSTVSQSEVLGHPPRKWGLVALQRVTRLNSKKVQLNFPFHLQPMTTGLTLFFVRQQLRTVWKGGFLLGIGDVLTRFWHCLAYNGSRSVNTNFCHEVMTVLTVGPTPLRSYCAALSCREVLHGKMIDEVKSFFYH